MSQFSSNNSSSPVISSIPHPFQQNQQNSQNFNQHQFVSQNQQNSQTSPNSTNSASSALVSAAAQFYVRSSQDQFNRRSNIAPASNSSPATPVNMIFFL